MLQPQPTESTQPTRRFEISAVLLLALGVLALVSLFSSAAGIVGTWIASGLRYTFGSLSIVPPIMLIVHALLSLRYGRRVHYTRKALAVVSLYVVALCTVHLFSHQPANLSQVWSVGSQTTGGGVLGGLLSYVFLRAVGPGGSWVLLAAWFITSLIFLTETSVSRFVARIFRVVGNLFRGLFLGWNDFWRGVRLELAELIGLIRKRKASHGDAVPAASKKKKRAVRRRNKKRKVKEQQADAWAEAAATETDDALHEAESMPTFAEHDGISHTLSRSEVADDEPTFTPPEQPEPTETPAEEEPMRKQRKKRTVHAGDEVLDVAANSGTNEAGYQLPSPSLLDRPVQRKSKADKADANQAEQLAESLELFGIDAKVVNVSRGPTVTRYEVQPAPGVKVKQITSLADDLALALAATGIRIEAPVPGKAVVGIEVPNKETVAVALRDVIETDAFQNNDSKLLMALGKDIAGKPTVADLRRLLHVLIAGATGSGKSVCINSIIISILYKAQPDEVKLLMIDPKRVELAVYDGIPHLVTPVVTDPKQAAGALRWAVKEMEHRYTQFSKVGARNIDGYNRYVAKELERIEAERAAQQLQAEEEQHAVEAEQREDDDADHTGEDNTKPMPEQNEEAQSSKEDDPEPLPYIVVIIDELADLMMVAQHDVEDSISRLAQMARAAGIHLIIATQRPSVDVITGLIKANVPSRISFAVSSSHDSRTILDMVGAERLVGKGDMLYYPSGENKPFRAQGAFVSDKEVQAVVDFWKAQGEPVYDEEVAQEAPAGQEMEGEPDDELYEDAVRLVMDTNTASISMLQRRFRIGYARAARLIDTMELQGIVGPYQGSKPREVLRRTMDDDE